MPGANGTPSGIRPARPTLNVGGQDNEALAQGLLNLLVVENTSGLCRCEATVGNWGSTGGRTDFLYFDRRTLEFGKTFQVKVGTEVVFEGRIMGLEAHFPQGQPAALTVLAEDRFQDLRMTRRTRTFADLSDAAVIRQVANEHGLSPQVDVSGPTHKVLAQVNQSDLAFLRERARAVDAELWVDGSNLHAKAHAGRTGGPVRLNYGRELREFTVLADLAGQRTSVAVNGWDVSSKAGLQFEATASALGGELNGTTSGASILSEKLGQRKEALAHTVPLTRQEAQHSAEAFFRMIARRFVTGRGVADADGRLRVGSQVDLQGLGPLFTGKYYLSEVRFLFDGSQGIRTEFVAERPGLGAP